MFNIIINIILYFFLWKKKEEDEEIKDTEYLQANIDYKLGHIYLYKSEERTDVFSQGEKVILP